MADELGAENINVCITRSTPTMSIPITESEKIIYIIPGKKPNETWIVGTSQYTRDIISNILYSIENNHEIERIPLSYILSSKNTLSMNYFVLLIEPEEEKNVL